MKETSKKIGQEKIGTRLLKIRSELGYSQELMAEKLDVSRSSVARWELNTNDVEPSLDTIKRYAEISGRSLDYIVNGKEPNLYSNDKVIKIVTKLKECEKVLLEIQKELNCIIIETGLSHL